MSQETPKQYDVVLFIPNTRWYGKRPWVLIPHSALILTGIFKSVFDFGIVDANIANLSEDEVESHFSRINPTIFLVSGVSAEYYAQYHKSFSLIKSINRKIITVFGGIYPTLLPYEALEDKNIDYIFQGPAEDGRAVRLIRCLLEQNHTKARLETGVGHNDEHGRSHVNGLKQNIIALMDAPEPDYSLINTKMYLNEQSSDYNIGFPSPTGVMLTSYGCRYNCVFCAARSIRGKSVAYRTSRNVIKEMKWLIENYNIAHFSFLDELFLGNRQRAEEILNFMAGREEPFNMENAECIRMAP